MVSASNKAVEELNLSWRCRMASISDPSGGPASSKSLKPMETQRPQAKKAAVSLYDDRDLEINVKNQSLKVQEFEAFNSTAIKGV